MKLEDIKSGAVIKGIDPAEPVRIVSMDSAGSDAATVYYKTDSDKAVKRMKENNLRVCWDKSLALLFMRGPAPWETKST